MSSMSRLADDIIALEAGELTTGEMLDVYSRLVESGVAWNLQGSYGRVAAGLIADGLLEPDGTITPAGQDLAARHEIED